MVAVRPRLTRLDAWGLGWGAVLGYVGLLGFLYLPTAFPLWLAAVGVPLLVATAFAVFRASSWVRRLLVPASVRRARADEMASAAFHRLGVRNTKERAGVLVLVFPVDAVVLVRADVGVAGATLDAELQGLEGCLVNARVPESLLGALERFGAVLAEQRPRRTERINELEDVA